MTDNIQKLYEIAGVKKKYCGWLDIGDLDTQYKYVMCDTLKEYKETAEFSRTSYSSDNNNYMTPEIKYPPFTAEKQLELIKLIQLLDNIDNLQMFHHELNNKWCFVVEMLPEFSNIPTERLHCSHEQFEQALASLVCEIWQELTDNQKQEIKEILE